MMSLRWHDLRTSRLRYRVLIDKWTHHLITAALLLLAGWMAYMAATAYMSLSEDRERAALAQAEAFELLNGRIFIADGEKFRLATEPLPKLIGE